MSNHELTTRPRMDANSKEAPIDVGTSTFRFLDLPPEIRNRVYWMSIPSEDSVTIMNDRTYTKYSSRLRLIKVDCAHMIENWSDGTPGILGLLLSCTTVRNEANPLFYSAFEFCFHDTELWFHFNVFCSRLSSLSFTSIRKIRFAFPAQMLLFSEELNRPVNHEGYAMEVTTGYMRHLTNLKTSKFGLSRTLFEYDLPLLRYLNAWGGSGQIILEIQHKSALGSLDSEDEDDEVGFAISDRVARELKSLGWEIDGKCLDDYDFEPGFTLWVHRQCSLQERRKKCDDSDGTEDSEISRDDSHGEGSDDN